jgi:hypothetical protein
MHGGYTGYTQNNGAVSLYSPLKPNHSFVYTLYTVKILKEGVIFTATWRRYTAVVTQSVCTQLQQYSPARSWGLTCTPHVKHRLYWPLCPFSQLNSFHRYYGNTAVICCAQGMSTEYFCPLLPRSNWWLSDRLTFTNVLQLKHRPSYIRVNAINVYIYFRFISNYPTGAGGAWRMSCCPYWLPSSRSALFDCKLLVTAFRQTADGASLIAV